MIFDVDEIKARLSQEGREAIEAYMAAVGSVDWARLAQTMRAVEDAMRAQTMGMVRWWQSSGLAEVGAALLERERIRQRQRTTAAKMRARIVTRVDGRRSRRPRTRAAAR